MKIGYARGSTETKTQPCNSRPSKKAGCQTLFKDEGISGATTKRPALLRCLKKLTNPDGSVDLYLQADSPGEAQEPNWLPAPKADFIPMLRLYWPKDRPPSILDGTWRPPAIKAVD